MEHKIFLLNLNRAPERLDKMIKQFEANNISNYLVYNAFDGIDLINKSLQLNINPRYVGGGRNFQLGEIGCTLSHIGMISMAKSLNLDYVIILEDDVILCDDFKESLYKVINNTPKNWEHIYLEARLYNYEPLLIPSIVQTTFKTSGTYSYIIRKTAYDKVIKKLSSLETSTDDLYSYMITNDKQLNSFTSFPFITMPGINSSYIWPELDMNNIHNALHPSHKHFKNNIK